MMQANERPSDKVFCLPLGRFYYGIALECVAETVQEMCIRDSRDPSPLHI